MAIKIEERIDELCALAAREQNYTKLKSVIGELLECIDIRQRQREEAKRISLPTTDPLGMGGEQNERSPAESVEQPARSRHR
jgi:hypothetical protein